MGIVLRGLANQLAPEADVYNALVAGPWGLVRLGTESH